jgi:branched-chain amino acid transport system permease protein
MTEYQLTTATLTCINIIVALGLYVTITSGQLSNGHAAIMGIGGYSAGYLAIHYEFSFWQTLVCSAVAGLVLGGLLSAMLVRLDGFYLAVATLVAAQALVNVFNNVDAVGGATGLAGIPLRGDLNVALPSALVAIFLVRMWERSLGGYVSRALGEDAEAAETCGVNAYRVRILCFAIGGALAGFAGAIQAQNLGLVAPTSMGFQAVVVLFFIVGLGGMTSYTGAVAGSIVVTILPEVLRFSVYDRYLYFGLALAVVMILRPHGMVPRVPLGRRPTIEGFRYVRDRVRRASSASSRDTGVGGPEQASHAGGIGD